MIFISPVALLFSLAISMSASAAPIVLSSLSERDVWAPPVINPTTGTIWKIGSDQTVTWDTSNPPSQVTNPIGTLLLGYLNADGSGGENLDVDNPLAQNFQLAAGSVTITVPKVEPNDNYIVALIGDSGNISNEFTITA
ncbi:hypothetical protein F5888DRAFT_1622238 [Russula emetica]|nr:hypothetical protein F5888DRAFT_1622878 [Russula emetica]KAF8489293.1 hypothetical protein F5888DRAFT_1622238 [Russula emetica]